MFRAPFVGFLTLCAFAAVSAEFADWFKNDEGGALVDRQRRDADSCSESAFDAASICCSVPKIISQTTIDACKAGSGEVRIATYSATGNPDKMKKKKKKKKKSRTSVSPDESTTTVASAAGRRRRSPGGENNAKSKELDCLLKTEEIITADGKFNYTAFKTKFSANGADENMKLAADSANRFCEDAASDAASKNAAKINPTKIYKCIRKALFKSCPAPQAATECETNLASVNQCEPFSKKFRSKPRGAGSSEETGARSGKQIMKKRGGKSALKRKTQE